MLGIIGIYFSDQNKTKCNKSGKKLRLKQHNIILISLRIDLNTNVNK